MRNIVCFALAFIGLFQFSALAQWEQVGTILGASGDGFGYNVEINSDGSKIVAGTVSNGSGNSGGYVSVYSQNGSEWILYGNSINFDETTGASNGNIGRPLAVDISADGNTIVIGDRGYEVGQFLGRVMVYKYENGNWNLDFETKNIPVNSTLEYRFGDHVSISDNGNRIAIAYPNYDGFKGRVVTYEFDGFNWIELGNALTGQLNSAQFGWNMDLSGNGNVLAIFEVGNQVTDGVVKIYKVENNIWVQEGASIPVSSPSNVAAGARVKSNYDGNIVVISNPQDDTVAEDSGSVKVYQNNNGNWQNLGQSLFGTSSLSFFGTAISLNKNGNILGVLSSLNISSQNPIYSVYKLGNNIWNVVDNDFTSEVNGFNFFQWQ